MGFYQEQGQKLNPRRRYFDADIVSRAVTDCANTGEPAERTKLLRPKIRSGPVTVKRQTSRHTGQGEFVAHWIQIPTKSTAVYHRNQK